MKVAAFLLLGLVVVQVCGDLTAPDRFTVEFVTTVNQNTGTFVVEAVRDWAPHGVDHFYTLLQSGTEYYDNNGFFRVVPGFVVQVCFPSNPVRPLIKVVQSGASMGTPM